METCKVCRHQWKSIPKKLKGDIPKSCPSCRSPLWNVGHNIKCEICERISFSPNIHHIDGNHKNHIKKNLIILCHDCHVTVHFGLDKKKAKGRKNRRRNYYSQGNIKSQSRMKTSQKILDKNFMIIRKIKYYMNELYKGKRKNETHM